MTEVYPSIIQGGAHADHRGTIRFYNSFEMSRVKRFYLIEHSDVETIRAWRGHRLEQRWFNVTSGEFLIKVVKIDDWEAPDGKAPVVSYKLSASENLILHIPNGYATGLKATEPNSVILVFADFGIEHAQNDDYLFDQDYFGEWDLGV